MIMQLVQSQRQQAKIKMGLQGPAGSGKTYSALLIAYGLIGNWQKIAVIDSENNSAHLYAHLGPYNVLGISQPFTPEKYIEAIELCEHAGIQAIILDSISHEWDGNGGILDIHGSMMGNSFTNWNKVTPRHNSFVQKILQSPAHILATIRSKQDYVLSEKNGKMVPEKVGLKGVTREGMDYEFTIVLDLDIKHNAIASKDRTGLFMDKPTFVPNPSTGERIQNWCQIRLSLEEVAELIQGITKIEELQTLYRKYPEYQQPLYDQFQRRKSQLQQPQTTN
jgi:hypothetical protein